ncbi:MAG: hypothetical protein WCI62_04730 [Erysipelotrichaceae bacterium]
MIDTSFELLGYFAENIQLKKTQKSTMDHVSIKIGSINLNGSTSVLSLKFEFKVDYDDSKNNTIDYMCGYILKDESLKEQIKNGIQPDGKFLSTSVIDDLVSEMVYMVFPFLRQHLYSLTSDGPKPILIPNLDIKRLGLRQGIEFKRPLIDPAKIN